MEAATTTNSEAVTRTEQQIREMMAEVQAEWGNAEGVITAPAGKRQMRALKLELMRLTK